jgi:hypothetical protein
MPGATWVRVTTDHAFDLARDRLDSRRRRSYDPRMPVWRCPHCGTPQAESSRCWVCRRSTTTCATCRHFRRGIASGLGLCGLDARRSALDGTEIRACWVPAEALHAEAGVQLEPVRELALAGVPDTERRAPRTFVPVEELVGADRRDPDGGWPVAGEAPARAASISAPPAGAVAPEAPSGPNGWSLWGDPEG